MERKNPDDLRQQGYTIDDTCYPWFAYKGARFAPEGETHQCYTDIESALIKMLRVQGISIDGMLKERFAK